MLLIVGGSNLELQHRELQHRELHHRELHIRMQDGTKGKEATN